MGFAMESQESKELSFFMFLGKMNNKIKKKQNTLYLGPIFSTKPRLLHFLASAVP